MIAAYMQQMREALADLPDDTGTLERIEQLALVCHHAEVDPDDFPEGWWDEVLNYIDGGEGAMPLHAIMSRVLCPRVWREI